MEIPVFSLNKQFVPLPPFRAAWLFGVVLTLALHVVGEPHTLRPVFCLPSKPSGLNPSHVTTEVEVMRWTPLPGSRHHLRDRLQSSCLHFQKCLKIAPPPGFTGDAPVEGVALSSVRTLALWSPPPYPQSGLTLISPASLSKTLGVFYQRRQFGVWINCLKRASLVAQ